MRVSRRLGGRRGQEGAHRPVGESRSARRRSAAGCGRAGGCEAGRGSPAPMGSSTSSSTSRPGCPSRRGLSSPSSSCRLPPGPWWTVHPVASATRRASSALIPSSLSASLGARPARACAAPSPAPRRASSRSRARCSIRNCFSSSRRWRASASSAAFCDRRWLAGGRRCGVSRGTAQRADEKEAAHCRFTHFVRCCTHGYAQNVLSCRSCTHFWHSAQKTRSVSWHVRGQLCGRTKGGRGDPLGSTSPSSGSARKAAAR